MPAVKYRDPFTCISAAGHAELCMLQPVDVLITKGDRTGCGVACCASRPDTAEDADVALQIQHLHTAISSVKLTAAEIGRCQCYLNGHVGMQAFFDGKDSQHEMSCLDCAQKGELGMVALHETAAKRQEC